MEFENLFYLITLLFLFFLLVNITKKMNRSKKTITQKLPPGPGKLPIIGSMHHLAGQPLHKVLRNLAKKHGGLMHLQLGEISAVIVSTPHMAKEILKTHDINFATRPQILASEIMTYNGLGITFAPYGDYWRQMRKICILQLLSSKMVRCIGSIREEEVSKMIKQIQSFSGSPINLTEKMFHTTNAVICRAAFGKRYKDEAALINLICETISVAGGFDLADLFPSWKFLRVITGMQLKLTKLHRKLNEVLDNIINEHEDKLMRESNGIGEPVKEDLVDVLLRLKESGHLDVPISIKGIKAVILELFSAGTESSAITTEWAMVELITHPRTMDKAQLELREVFKGKDTIHAEDLKELTYLKMVVKEILRLHPPAPLLLPRECGEERQIGGYDIPSKTKVMVNAWAINRDAEYWEDAESFIPDRFADSNIDFIGQNFEYLPFGGGRRICPGISFGLANIELLLARLLFHFNWKLPDGMKPENLDRTEVLGGTVRRKSDLILIAIPHTP